MNRQHSRFLKLLGSFAFGLGAALLPMSGAIALPPTNYTDPIGYPTSWPTTWTPYTSSGSTLIDPTTSDNTTGGANPTNEGNVAACTGGSVFFSRNANTLYFRLCLAGDPYITTASSGPYAASGSWSLLIDVTGDGFRDFAITLDGKASQSFDVAPDNLYVLYKNDLRQDFLNSDLQIGTGGSATPGAAVLWVQDSAVGSPTRQTPLEGETGWNTLGRDLQRTRTIDRGDGTYYLDIQVPLSALDASSKGGPVITENTPLSFAFATANSNTNPIQKDFAFPGDFTVSPDKPIPFGDVVIGNTTFLQPNITAISNSGCGASATLSSNVLDTLKILGTGASATFVSSVNKVEFYYQFDSDNNSQPDLTGPWTLIGPGTLAPNTTNPWRISWNTSSLGQGTYFIKTIATDTDTPTPHVTDSTDITNGGSTDTYNPATQGTTPIFSTFNNTCGLPTADVVTTKTGPATVTAGSNITYSITTTNNGPATATNVVIKDTLPTGTTFVSATNGGTQSGGVVTWPNIPSLASGVGNSVTYQVTVTAPRSAGSLLNRASSTATTSDPNAANNDGTAAGSQVATTITGTPDLTITKTHTGNFSKVGSNTYTLIATNSGTAATNGTVTVSDTVPTGLTPTAATGTGWACIISGQVVTCTRSDALAANTSYPPITLTVNVAPTASASITNTATVSGGGQTNTSNDSVNDPTTINPLADLSLTKVVSNASPNVRDNVTFTVRVSNAGPDSATGVSVADLLPAGLTFVSETASQGTYSNTTGVWSVGSLASATNATLQITASVATAGAKTNIAQVSASGQQDPDSTPNNSVATEDDQASVTVTPPTTDLSIVKTDSPDPVIAGANLTYAIAVTNTGSTATNVVMSDPLPSGTTFQSITAPSGWNCTTPAVGINGTVSCTNTSMAVGTSNFTLVVRVDPNTANNASLSNTATVSSTTSDSNTSNNSSSQTTTVRQSADLRLTKVSTPASPNVGDTFEYTITVTNDGPSTATNVQVRDALPLGIGYVLNRPSQGTYDPIGTQVWNVGTLNSGASATLVIRAIRNSAANTVNTAEVIAADQSDPDSPHNNQVAGEDDQDSVTVPNQSVDLAVTKTVNNSTPSVGQNVTFTITVANPAASTVTATNIGINDVLPQGLTYQSHNESTGTYNRTTGVWSVASLAPGTTATLTLVAQVTTSGAKTNTAQLSTLDQSDPNANNDSGSATVTATTLPPNLVLVKRITEVAGTPSSGFNDLTTGSKAADDNNANWPTPLATYLRGLFNGGSVAPGAEVEYTIYFLNNQNAATNVTICDPVPANMTFVSDGYNSASPRPTESGALPTDTGIALASNAATLPINPTFYLTNANDSDRGRYYPPNDPSTPNACKRVDAAGLVTATGAAANTNGAIVVNVVSGANQLPPATASGNPTNSYGYIRFKARVR